MSSYGSNSSIISENISDIESVESDSDFSFEDNQLCTSLKVDIENYRKEYYGDSSLIINNKLLGIINVILCFKIDNISKNVAQAWGIDLTKDLCISFDTTCGSFLLDCPKNINIFQYSKEGEILTIGIKSQLMFIVQNFFHSYYRPLTFQNWETFDKLIELGFNWKDVIQACIQNKSFDDTIELLFNLDKQINSQCYEINNLAFQYFLRNSSKEGSFMLSLAHYVKYRIPTLHEHCVICDQAHLFSYKLIKPAVCRRDLCVFTLQQFNILSDAELATQGEVIDLLLAMAKSAANSNRASSILNPFPNVFDPSDSNILILDPDKPNHELAKQHINNISIPGSISMKDMNKEKGIEYALLQWIVNSNRTHLAKLPQEYHIKSMNTDYQYIMLSATPEREETFQKLKKQYGSQYAFHGSRVENWHSILRNGLKNASGTNLQLNGAAYGNGIYLSTISSTSFSYSMMSSNLFYNPGQNNTITTKQDENGLLLQSGNWICLALCEVAQVKNLKKTGGIWVAPNEDSVITRFFFVYKTVYTNFNFDTQLEQNINEIRHALAYTQ